MDLQHDDDVFGAARMVKSLDSTSSLPHANRSSVLTDAVYILHPGYSSPNLLFSLAASDSRRATDGSTRFGVHYSTVMAACGILVNNQSNGWLTNATTQRPIDALELDDVLPAGQYFFNLPQPSASRPGDALSGTMAYRYPIVPAFVDFVVPDPLPDLWATLKVQQEHIQSDHGRCILSGAEDGLRQAHIVPKSESSWYEHNAMMIRLRETPVSYTAGVDLPSNIVNLRADLHLSWDNDTFIFVPKRIRSRYEHSQVALVAHIVDKRKKESFYLWHNRCTTLPKTCHMEVFFARFAWFILQQVFNRFLRSCPDKKAVLIRKDNGEFEAENREPREIFNRGFTSAKRSASDRLGSRPGSSKKQNTNSAPSLIPDHEYDDKELSQQTPDAFITQPSDYRYPQKTSANGSPTYLSKSERCRLVSWTKSISEDDTRVGDEESVRGCKIGVIRMGDNYEDFLEVNEG